MNYPVTIVIRVDSGNEIGAGHARRCLSVAILLRKNGFTPIFVCRKISGNINHLIKKSGFKIVLLSENKNMRYSVFSSDFTVTDYERMKLDAEESAYEFRKQYPKMEVSWVITDHMLIRKPWQSVFSRLLGCKVLAIDGLADYEHAADIIIDPQVSERPSEKWSELTSKNCTVFCGPSYIPLTPSFASARKSAEVRNEKIERVLVCFGGTEPYDIVYRSVSTLMWWINYHAGIQLAVDIAVPSGSNSVDKLRGLVGIDKRYQLYEGLSDLSGLMLNASIAIGGGGIMLWERCLLGLPAIVVPLAENQKKPIERLEYHGAIKAIKSASEGYESNLVQALNQISENPDKLKNMSEKSLKIMADWPATDDWLKIMKGCDDE